MIQKADKDTWRGTVELSSGIAISLNFTAEHTERAEASKKPSQRLERS